MWFQNFVMDMPYDIRIQYPKIDFQLPGNLTDDSIVNLGHCTIAS